MKKFLPKSLANPSGFTLIELMVVVSIIAILSVIGIVAFGNTQKNARDTRRRSDIDAISKALEVNKNPGLDTYNVLVDTQFAQGKVPTDSGNGSATYCANASTTAGSPPAVPTAWSNTSACPTSYATVSITYPAATAKSWTICALLETGLNPNNIFCRQSAQ